jgi:hypothetical protein
LQAVVAAVVHRAMAAAVARLAEWSIMLAEQFRLRL